MKIKNKKGMDARIWILIILAILIIGGVIAYLLLSGNGISILDGGNSIPNPPALPN
jgi:hypothetical protein